MRCHMLFLRISMGIRHNASDDQQSDWVVILCPVRHQQFKMSNMPYYHVIQNVNSELDNVNHCSNAYKRCCMLTMWVMKLTVIAGSKHHKARQQPTTTTLHAYHVGHETNDATWI